MSGSSDSPERLRPEAQPVVWTKLGTKQKAVVRELASALRSAIDEVDGGDRDCREEDGGSKPKPYSSVVPWLSPDRRSRLMFVSGERGTGKTTAFLSLVRAATNDKALDEVDEQKAGRDIQKLRNRIVWLEPLDLEAWPESSHQLSALLARIKVAAKVHPDREPFGDMLSQAVSREDDGVYTVWGELDRLQQEVGIAWHGNLENRKGNLDPERFAMEIDRVETARIATTRKLESLLDDLARQRLWGASIENPIFVLPIDDFDLDPVANLDVLHMLRLVAVPRLFFLILGDMNITERVVQLRKAGDFVRAGAIPGTGADYSPVALDSSMVAEVANNILNKHVPPSQRIYIGPLNERESLEFAPLSMPDRQLWQYLKEISLGRTPVKKASTKEKHSTRLCDPPTNVLELLNWNLPKKERGKVPRGANFGTYVGSRALGSTPRRLADLCYRLKRAIEREDEDSQRQAARRLAAVTDFLGSTLLESAHLPDRHRREIAEIMRELHHGTPVAGLTIDASVQTSASSERFALPLGTERPSVALASGSNTPSDLRSSKERKPGIRFAFETRTPLSWELRIGDDGSPRYRLDSAAAASVALLHDLAIYADSALLRYQAEQIVRLRVLGSEFAATVWHAPDGRLLRFAWPIPPLQTFADVDKFKRLWAGFAGRRMNFAPAVPKKPAVGINVAAFAWIEASLVTMLGEHQTEVGAETEGNPTDAWSSLVTRMDHLIGFAKQSGHLQSAINRWLVDVALMLMPENGVDWSGRKRAVEGTALREFWLSRATEIRARREVRLGILAASGIRTSTIREIMPFKVFVDAVQQPVAKDELLSKWMPSLQRVDRYSRQVEVANRTNTNVGDPSLGG